MKTFKTISIAVLSLMTAACSSDVASEQPSESHQDKGIPFTATISMKGNTTRSAMTENGNTISAVWETGDELALVYEVSGQKKVTKATMTVRDDKSATITATIAEGVTMGTAVMLLYPYSAVSDNAEDTSYGAIKKDAFGGQDGKLESIAKQFDLCQGDGNFTVSSENKASLKADVTMKSQMAIWKLSLSDGTNAINASKLVVKDGGNNVLTTVTLAPATNSLYIAMAPADQANMNFEATVGDDIYTYSKTGITLEAGKYYVSAMTMKAPEPGKMTVSAAGYKAAYNGNAHGITVSVTNPATGATVKYGETEGTYNLDASPTYTDAGKHTVYYQVTCEGYTTVTGSADVEISQVAATISFKDATVTKTYGDAAFTNTLTNTGDGKVKYSTTATNITVNESTGEVTIVGAGEATIKATVTDGKNYTYTTKEISYTLTVNAKTVAVTGVTLNKTSLDMKVGDSETLTATVAPTDATNKTVTWKSNKESVATVDANGKVTAVAAGEATITVTTTDGSKTADCKVTVDGSTTVNPGGGYVAGGEI